MDWAAYKALAARADVLPRALLERTLAAAQDASVRRALTDLLRGPPLPRPDDALADARADLFRLRLEAGVVQAIIAGLADAEVSAPGRHRHALIVWREYLHWIETGPNEYEQEEPTMSGTAHSQAVVDRLMQAFDRRDVEGIAGCFAPDAIYHNIPMEPVHGVDAIKASLAPFVGMASEVKFEVLRTVANGNVVMNERIDRFNIGGKWLSIAVMGVFEVGPAGITAWRDYFDLAQFQSQMAAIQGG